MVALRDVLTSTTPAQNVRPWSNEFDSEGKLTIKAISRYFSTRREVGNAPGAAFTQDVDPRGVLADVAAAGNWVHTEENQVGYYEREKKPDG